MKMKLRPVFCLLALLAGSVHAEIESNPPPLSEKISSFGACVSDGYVYVYGGHTGNAHDHSSDNLTGAFHRYPLHKGAAAWEDLPNDRAVQGTALVGWNGLVIRVAGMYATNAHGEAAEMYSTDELRCFDPRTKTWKDWPSLPDKVSSHDALVVGDTLYVVGGWKLDGSGDGNWHPHGWSLDLKNRDKGWKDLQPMPGIRRAGTLAAAGGEIWWVGGMADKGGSSNASFAYHPDKGVWREGPALPGTSSIKAFGSSTFSTGGILFNSGMDGVLYSLDPAGDEWAVTQVNHQHGRIFHRSIPVGKGLFWTIAGASKRGHRNDIEVLPVPGQFPVVSNRGAWRSFRGGANNEVSARDLVEHWNDSSNVAWKASLSGYGQSTPVFGGGGIYVTSAIAPEEGEGKNGAGAGDVAPVPATAASGERSKDAAKNPERLMQEAKGPLKTEMAVTRIDQAKGEISWTATFAASDLDPRSKYRSCAAPSPCLDEDAVYAWFESGDLVALSHEGDELWRRDLGGKYGLPKGNHGFGSSLVQDEDALYLLVDHDGPSYLLCLEKKDGGTRWKVDRPERISWSTPVVTRDALVICSNGLVEERDKSTGEQRWVVEGLEGNTAASPLVFRDYVLAPSSDRGQTQLIRRGKVEPRVVWKANKNTASFASPVFAQGQVILVNKAGIASGLDWRTGEERWVFRLPEGCWATPVVLGKNIYFFSKGGTTLVAGLTPSGLHEMHRNQLTVESSRVYGVIPAGNQWIVRTGSEVIALAGQKDS